MTKARSEIFNSVIEIVFQVMIERCNGKLRMNVKTFSDLDISYRACTNNFTKYSNIFNYNYQGCNFEKSLRECDQVIP